jgi:hypothetical protein
VVRPSLRTGPRRDRLEIGRIRSDRFAGGRISKFCGHSSPDPFPIRCEYACVVSARFLIKNRKGGRGNSTCIISVPSVILNSR